MAFVSEDIRSAFGSKVVTGVTLRWRQRNKDSKDELCLEGNTEIFRSNKKPQKFLWSGDILHRAHICLHRA